jgi:hypothetical protein
VQLLGSTTIARDTCRARHHSAHPATPHPLAARRRQQAAQSAAVSLSAQLSAQVSSPRAPSQSGPEGAESAAAHSSRRAASARAKLAEKGCQVAARL